MYEANGDARTVKKLLNVQSAVRYLQKNGYTVLQRGSSEGSDPLTREYADERPVSEHANVEASE